MGASLRRAAAICLAGLALSAGCGDVNDDLRTPGDAAAGASGAGASGGATGSGGAGGSSGSGGAAASGGSGGTSGGSGGSGGASGAAAGGSSGAQGSAGSADAATDSSDEGGKSGAGGVTDGGTDANFCLPPPCLETPPVAGSTCSPCARPTLCTYNSCSGSGNAIVTATCDESSRTWVIKSDPCNSFQCGPPPGGRRCNANQICVLPFATCADNPCGDQPFSCSCAQTACPGVDHRCVEQGDRTISCLCLTC